MIKRLLFVLLLSVSIMANSAEPYKVYTAKITQVGNSDPTIKVMENTLGDISWTRLSNGYYRGYLANAFPRDYTFMIVSAEGQCAFIHGDGSEIILITRKYDGLPRDGVLIFGGYIEIRVYNYE